jgi:HEAT repeat protein
MKGDGVPAIPDILKVANDPKRGPLKASGVYSVQQLALRVIGDMGPQAASAVPGVAKFLSHSDQLTRLAAVEALLAIGPAAVEDPSPIVAALRDEWGGVRTPASQLLRAHKPDLLKEEIQKMLSSADSSDWQRRDACEWAGKFGTSGRDLLPSLKKARNAHAAVVSLAAGEAIGQIDPPAENR